MVATRIALASVLLLLCAGGAALASPYPRVAHNPADRLTSLPAEGFRYDYAKRCLKQPAKGALALQRWLEANSRGSSWGIMRCERLGGQNYSLHAEGRAIDWRLNVHDPADRRAADRLIRLLLAPDSAGSPAALARRMGIQEVIWDCRSWWSGAERVGPYSACFERNGEPKKRLDETLAHRNHVHVGLNLDGARMRTSFWRG